MVAAALLLVLLFPVRNWLLEHAPDRVVQWEAHRVPGDPRPHLILGERLLVQGKTRAALEQFALAATPGTEDFRLAVDLADAMRAGGLYDRAAVQSRELLQVEPHSGRLYRILGQCQIERGQLSEGLVSLQSATRLAPHDTDAWIALAEARLGIEGFRPETMRVWEEAVRQNPNQPTLRHGLAETDVGLGRYQEAEALLSGLPEEPVPARPKARELYARAWCAWGTVLHRLQPDAARLARARQALQRSLDLAPGQPEAQYEMGLLQADSGDWEAARRSLVTATRLRPYAHPFWYHLARVDRRLGLRGEAERAERRFDLLVSTFAAVNRESHYLDAHPTDITRRLRLARLLIEREDWEAASLHLSLVLRGHPGQAEATRLVRRLTRSRSRGIGVPRGE